MAARAVLLIVAALAGAAAARNEVTPVQKLVSMLDSLVAKGKAEKQAEEVEFAKFHQWCDGVKAEKTKSIKQGASQIVQLSSDIAKAEADAETLAEEIKGLEADVAQMEDEHKKAKAVRNKEHEDFAAMHKDFSESIDACQRAIEVLKARTADVPQSLLQLTSSPMVPDKAKAVIQAFLEMGTGADTFAPEANAYENQSGGVIAIIEKLKLKFEDQRRAIEKDELSAKGNFEVLSQQLTDDILNAKKSTTKKTETKASRQEDGAQAKADLATTESTKEDDESTLSDTNTECDANAREYEKNQVTRSEEIKALEKATEIIQSGSVAGHAETHLPALLQKARSSFAQLRSVEEDPRARLVEYLQKKAKQTGSKYLGLVATHAAEDPFAKIKGMVKDLIVKLMEEANAEADSNAYCTTELATNKQTRENKASEVEEIEAEIEQLSSNSAQLADQIAELSGAVATLRDEQSEANGIRGEEKATNAKTIADAKEAQTAVTAATKVLRDFYDKAAEAASASSLLQTKQKNKEPYQGAQSASGGIFAMLEVILSDFARLEAETAGAEDDQSRNHEQFTNESTETVAVKETEIDHKENNKRRTDEKVRSLSKERDLTQGELDAALNYFSKLKADCVDTGLSYEDRAKGRDEEIQSLKEALEILQSGM